jgi:hypothetical protein
MPWFAYILVVEFIFSAGYQIYLIDRVRKPKTVVEGVVGAAELLLFTIAVIILGTNYCG